MRGCLNLGPRWEGGWALCACLQLAGEPCFTAGWMELSASPQATLFALATHHWFLKRLPYVGVLAVTHCPPVMHADTQPWMLASCVQHRCSG